MNNYQPPEQLLKNKTILITGAGDGIGKVAALSYAKLGAQTILVGRTEEKLIETKHLIEETSNSTPLIYSLDFAHLHQQNFNEFAVCLNNNVFQLDGILHNASVLGNIEPIEQISEQTWLEVMQVNVNATLYLTQALLPLAKKANSSSIIFTSSSVGRKGRANWGSYSISKFATEAIMQIFADEYKNTSIRFNCINPGATRTNMRASAFPTENPLTLKTPEQIMPSYCYLMGDDSISVNGASIDCQPK